MWIEVGRCLGAQSAAETVHPVACQYGVYRTDVDVVGVVGLDRVLEECLQSEDDILHALRVGYVVDEGAHLALALGQFHLAVLVPELLVAHLGTGLYHLVALVAEEFVGQRLEGIFRQTCGACDEHAAHEREQFQFGGHVVDGLHPLAVRQPLVFLRHLHVLHEVDVALLGNGQLGTTDVECRVVEDEQFAAETHVLLVVGQEVQMDAAVVVDHHRVFDIEAVEIDALVGHRRDEGVLQQAHHVFVEVDIGEDILDDGIEDVAGLEEVVDTFRGLSGDDGLLRLGTFAIDTLRDGLVDADGQYQLARVGTWLHLLQQPRVLREGRLFELLRR